MCHCEVARGDRGNLTRSVTLNLFQGLNEMLKRVQHDSFGGQNDTGSEMNKEVIMRFTKIGVVGAGAMGRGIAQKIAQENIPVVMVDTEPRLVGKGFSNIRDLLQEAVEKKLFTPARTKQILNNIQGTTDINALKDADLVIEAVFEDKKTKKDLFINLDRICSDQTILASNTSSLSISELASGTKRPDKFVGLHYFYHPVKNRLLEIIPGKDTSKETINTAKKFANVTGKTVILARDTPGFIVNRFFVPWLNESVRLLEEGIANITTIDESAKQAFKIGMGPFQLMNVTGTPIAYHSAETLGKKLGQFYAPAKRLKEQFQSKNQWDLKGEVDESKMEVVKERLLGVVFFIVTQLVDSKIATVEDIDRGAKIGLRWARGPFELMSQVGEQRATQMVEEIIQKYGLRNI